MGKCQTLCAVQTNALADGSLKWALPAPPTLPDKLQLFDVVAIAVVVAVAIAVAVAVAGAGSAGWLAGCLVALPCLCLALPCFCLAGLPGLRCALTEKLEKHFELDSKFSFYS